MADLRRVAAPERVARSERAGGAGDRLPSTFRVSVLDTAYIYDVLCYFFYFAALLFYIRIRQQKRVLSGWELVACSVLYICALNAKQMAVTLPIFLFSFEVLYGKIGSDSFRALLRWITREGRFILLASLFTLAFLIGQNFGVDSYLNNKAYQPVFTWGRFSNSSRNFANEIFFQKLNLPFLTILLLWIGLLALAWAARSRTLKFAWLFLMLSVLPVAFIDRGAPQYYIPLFGWVLYAATVLASSSRYLLELGDERTRTRAFCHAGRTDVCVLPGDWLVQRAIRHHRRRNAAQRC